MALIVSDNHTLSAICNFFNSRSSWLSHGMADQWDFQSLLSRNWPIIPTLGGYFHLYDPLCMATEVQIAGTNLSTVMTRPVSHCGNKSHHVT